MDISRLSGLNNVRAVRKELANLASDWETLRADEDEWERLHPSPAFLGAWRQHRQVYGYTLRSELVYAVKKALEQDPDFELEREFTHVLVDEYQDLNKCEIDVIRRLVGDGRNLLAAGDDDQSIYAFRNAFPQGLRVFPETYAGAAEGELAECHRCDRLILDLAVNVAAQDPGRITKDLHAMPGCDDGQVEAYAFRNTGHEAAGVARIARQLVDAGVPAREILVLLRSDPGGVYSSPIAEALVAEGLVADIRTDPFAILSEDEPRLALCLIRLAQARADSLAWRQVLKLRDNGIGDSTLRAVYELAFDRGERYAAVLAAIEADPEIFESPRRNVVRDEYREISAIIDQLTLLLEGPASEGLNIALDAAGATGDARAEVRDLLLGLVEENDEATFADLIRELQRVGSYKSDREEPLQEGVDAVRIMSMHAAKGLTSDAVIVAACEDELIPGLDPARQVVDDERRLLYVSLTRARHHLFVTYASSRPGEQTFRITGIPINRTYTQFLRDFLPPQIV
jgi:DNA helicase II / ATP-dependent DNA helicase PcrA